MEQTGEINMQILNNFNTPMADYFNQGYACGYKDATLNSEQKSSDKEVDLSYNLTKQELDILVSLLTEELHILNNAKKMNKRIMNYWYNRCDKENSAETGSAFKAYSDFRKMYKNIRKKNKVVSEIQRKLKRLRSA